MLPVENNFNKNGFPNVYIALFWCLWVTVGGFRAIQASFTFWRLASPKEKHTLGEANRQNVKLSWMALKPPTGTQRHQNNTM